MLYLKASSKIQTLDSWKGRQGKFLKVFLVNDQRNKNGWRATWQSIEKNVKDAIDHPGIEYEKCEGSICDLDHTDAATYDQNLKVQESFRVTNIVDYELDAPHHTAYAIHEVLDDEFWEKVISKKIRYVSPSIWPVRGSYEILGRDNRGNLIIDVYDWRFLHSAFVNKPAFGDDAKIVAQCEGHGKQCSLSLLKANIDESNPLAPLMQVPLLVRHRKKLVFVSASECVQNKIQEKIDKGIKITDKELVIAYSECGESKKGKECSPCAKKAAELKDLRNRIEILQIQSRIQKLKQK